MRAGEVLKTLGISRSTLMRWRRLGVIRAEELENGRYEFNDLDVYKLKAKYKNDNLSKKKVEELTAEQLTLDNLEKVKGYMDTAIYARTSIMDHKDDLDEQTADLLSYAKKHKMNVTQIYREYASGLSLDRTKTFVDMMENVLEGRFKRVLVTSPDRLSRNSFVFLEQLFNHVGVEIICLRPETDLRYNREGASEMMRIFKLFDKLNPKITIPADFKPTEPTPTRRISKPVQTGKASSEPHPNNPDDTQPKDKKGNPKK